MNQWLFSHLQEWNQYTKFSIHNQVDDSLAGKESGCDTWGYGFKSSLNHKEFVVLILSYFNGKIFSMVKLR